MSNVAYQFQDDPGLYVIQLNARWKDSGYVSYGFLVQVGPTGDGLNLPASPPETPFLTATPQSLQVLPPQAQLGHGTVSTLAASPDGKWLGIVTPLGITLYATATQKRIWFRQFENKPVSLAFSPDGTRLAIGLAGSIMPVVDTHSGQIVLELKGEEGLHATWSPDGKHLLTSGGCEQILVWDALSGQIVHEILPVKCNNVTPGYLNATWSWDGKIIYATDTTGGVKAWDAQTYQPLESFQSHPPEYTWSLAISASPKRDLFALNDGNAIAIMDGKTGALVKILSAEGIENLLEDMRWSPDGKTLLSLNTLWEVESGKLIKKFDDFSVLAWLGDNDTLVGYSYKDASLEAFSITSDRTLFRLAGFGALNGYGLTPYWKGDSLFTYDGASVMQWEAASGKLIAQSPVSQAPAWVVVTAADYSPDGRRRVIWPGTIIDSTSRQELVHIAVAPVHGRDVNAWSPDGTRIVSGDSLGLDPTIVWDASGGKILLTLALNAVGNPFLGALAWSPDGAWICAGGSLMNSGSYEGMIAIWDAKTGEQVHLLTAAMNSERIQSIAWSHDGRWLAAGMYSGRIVLWDMHRFIPVADLVGHADIVNGLSWSSNDALLASSSSDGTIMVWKVP